MDLTDEQWQVMKPSYHQIAFGPIDAVVHGAIGELH